MMRALVLVAVVLQVTSTPLPEKPPPDVQFGGFTPVSGARGAGPSTGFVAPPPLSDYDAPPEPSDDYGTPSGYGGGGGGGGGGPTKTIYVNVPHYNPYPQNLPPVVAGPPRKHYKIVFVRAPPPPPVRQPILPPRTEQKTLIYVLHQRPKPQEQQVINVPSVQHDPEVFFVQYDKPPTAEDLQQLSTGNLDGYNLAAQRTGSLGLSDEVIIPDTVDPALGAAGLAVQRMGSPATNTGAFVQQQPVTFFGSGESVEVDDDGPVLTVGLSGASAVTGAAPLAAAAAAPADTGVRSGLDGGAGGSFGIPLPTTRGEGGGGIPSVGIPLSAVVGADAGSTGGSVVSGTSGGFEGSSFGIPLSAVTGGAGAGANNRILGGGNNVVTLSSQDLAELAGLGGGAGANSVGGVTSLGSDLRLIGENLVPIGNTGLFQELEVDEDQISPLGSRFGNFDS